ncbi:MAG: VOC family protein [Planctomycetota bacterium]
MAETMNPVCWFEIPASDINRAKAYYEATLGAEITLHEMPSLDGGVIKMGWFPMNPDGAGATGSLVEHAEYTPSHHGTVVYFSREDIPAVCARGEAAGGKTLLPESSIGEHGFMAFLEDTEGNRIGLHRQVSSQ